MASLDITTALSTSFHFLPRYLKSLPPILDFVIHLFLSLSVSLSLSLTLLQPPPQSLTLSGLQPCVNVGIFRRLFLQSSVQATCPLPTSLRSRLKSLPPLYIYSPFVYSSLNTSVELWVSIWIWFAGKTTTTCAGRFGCFSKTPHGDAIN